MAWLYGFTLQVQVNLMLRAKRKHLRGNHHGWQHGGMDNSTCRRRHPPMHSLHCWPQSAMFSLLGNRDRYRYVTFLVMKCSNFFDVVHIPPLPGRTVKRTIPACTKCYTLNWQPFIPSGNLIRSVKCVDHPIYLGVRKYLRKQP